LLAEAKTAGGGVARTASWEWGAKISFKIFIKKVRIQQLFTVAINYNINFIICNFTWVTIRLGAEEDEKLFSTFSPAAA
jgi:hypothetical protein